MKYYLLGIGGEGTKIAESMLWAACAGVIRVQDGRPLQQLQMLMIDTDQMNQRAERAEVLLRTYETVRLMSRGGLRESAGFRTQLMLQKWMIQADSIQAVQGDQNEKERLLMDMLYGTADMKMRVTRGLNGHADVGMLLFAGILTQLEQSADSENAYIRIIEDMQKALQAGEEIRVVLCGASFGGTGAAGVSMLARDLRRRMAGAGNQVRLAAVMIAPYETHDDDLRAVDRSKAALENMALSGLVGNDEQPGVLDAVYVVGLPASCFVQAEENRDAHLVQWMAARSICDYFERKANEAKGCFWHQSPEETLTWDVFDFDNSAWRQGYGGLLRTAALFMAEFAPVLEQRLGEKAQLRDMLGNWYAANFRTSRQMTEDDVKYELNGLRALTACLRGYAVWMAQMLNALPLIYRNGSEHINRARQAAEHYRRVLNQAGRIYLLEEEIHRSGIEQEQIVTRVPTQVTAADEMLQLTEEKYAELAELTAQQAALDKRLGGATKLRTMRRMAAGIRQALEKDGEYAEEGRRALLEANKRAVTAQDELALRSERERLFSLEAHLELLRAQSITLRNEMAAFEKRRLYTAVPEIPANERAVPASDIISGDVLSTLLRVMAEEDKKQRAQLVRDLAAGYSRLVLPDSGVEMNEVLSALARQTEELDATSLLGQFLRRVLKVTEEEGRA